MMTRAGVGARLSWVNERVHGLRCGIGRLPREKGTATGDGARTERRPGAPPE